MMQSLNANGANLHFHAQTGIPGAKTLVFINSLGTDFRIWQGVLKDLGARFNHVLHDKRGHGLSSIGQGEVTIKTYADDLELLLQDVGAQNVILCGLSVGGLIAQHLMLHSKLDIRGVVLSNTGCKIGTDESWKSRITAIEEGGIEAIADQIMERWLSPDFRARNPEMLALCRTMLARTPQAHYIACCKAIRDASFDHSKAARRIPTLCFGGEHDGSTPPALVKAMAAEISGANYIEFSGAGHLPNIERPSDYAAELAKFANSV